VKVFGIDPSLTSTGLAYIHDDEIRVGLASSAGKRNDTIVQRHERIGALAHSIAHWEPWFNWGGAQQPRHADVIVVEGPTPGTRGGSVWDRAGLWWHIVGQLPVQRVAVIPPSTRAKWATGKGNADKAAVAAIAARLCPDVELRNSDQADALILALMGAHALGQRPDLNRVYRTEALLKCQWPADIAARLLEPYERPVQEVAP
jgi:Holliday junction resolvasome RuvABC endonuclease subunit